MKVKLNNENYVFFAIPFPITISLVTIITFSKINAAPYLRIPFIKK